MSLTVGEAETVLSKILKAKKEWRELSLNITRTEAQVRRIIMLYHEAQAAYAAFQAVRMAAGDPFAWIGFGLAATTIGADIATELSGR